MAVYQWLDMPPTPRLRNTLGRCTKQRGAFSSCFPPSTPESGHADSFSLWLAPSRRPAKLLLSAHRAVRWLTDNYMHGLHNGRAGIQKLFHDKRLAASTYKIAPPPTPPQSRCVLRHGFTVIVGRSPTCPDCTEGATHFSAGCVSCWRKVFMKPNILYFLFRIIAKQMYEYGATDYQQVLTVLQKQLVDSHTSRSVFKSSSTESVSPVMARSQRSCPHGAPHRGGPCRRPSFVWWGRYLPHQYWCCPMNGGRGTKWFRFRIQIHRVCTLAAAGFFPRCWI